MLVWFANTLAAGFDDRAHDDLSFGTGVVGFGDDVTGESVPTRFCQCQMSCFQQVWLGQFHLGFKALNGFTEVETKLADVRSVAGGNRHWCAVVQGSA